MFKIASRVVALNKTTLTRSLPSFSTSASLLATTDCPDPTNIPEAPRIDTEELIGDGSKKKLYKAAASVVQVPAQVDLTPISGVPDIHIRTRLVRIYQPAKNAMQSGTSNIHHWEMEFDNRQRWENPLMGWTSTGDPLSNMKVSFSSPEEAIRHCEKNGWKWYVDYANRDKVFKRQNYGLNFSWNKRTRVSTK